MTHTLHEELMNWLGHQPQPKNAHMRRLLAQVEDCPQAFSLIAWCTDVM